MIGDFYLEYIKKLEELLKKVDLNKLEEVTDILDKTHKRGSNIYVMGNGGSSSTASHFVCDLMTADLDKYNDKRCSRKFKAISLNDNNSLITALTNDLDSTRMFEEQLKNLLEKDDVVIVISASGNSKNVINATKYAKKIGAKTIGFLGFDGGKLLKLVDVAILAQDFDYGRVEDSHLILSHVIAEYFRNVFK